MEARSHSPVADVPLPTRSLVTLPKAHLHLHFTGSMRHSTLVELAAAHGVHLPDALMQGWPPTLHATDERGWFRFQRLYDIARSVLRTERDLRRLLLEAAQDEAAEGSPPRSNWCWTRRGRPRPPPAWASV